MLRDFKQALEHFIRAGKLVLQRNELRVWYWRRLRSAILVGSILLVFFAITLALGFWFVFDQLVAPSVSVWLSSAAGVLIGLLWLVVLYFTAGPVSLLALDMFLSETTNWEDLAEKLNVSTGKMKPDESAYKIQARSLIRTLKLIVLILFLSLLGLIPVFAFIPFLVSSFALGYDAAANVDDLFQSSERKRQSFAFYIGLGFAPSLFASIPVLGVLLLPLLQMASLLRYAEQYDDVAL